MKNRKGDNLLGGRKWAFVGDGFRWGWFGVWVGVLWAGCGLVVGNRWAGAAEATGGPSAFTDQSTPKASAKRPPNILFILADDLGYAELGCYGQQKIKTPHLDRLASQGMRFTLHYSGSPVCAPSRCVLLTGKHPGHAAIRNNKEMKQLPDEVARRYGIEPEFSGQQPLPDEEITLAELLKKAGYTTACIGKWGLGQFGTSGDPNRQGFDLFYGYNCQRHAHSYYPAYLWENGRKVPLDNDPPVPGHAKLPAGADPNDPASYRPFQGKDYAPDRMLRRAEEFIRQNKDRPFFLFYTTTLVHLALHVPEEDLKPYLGLWPETPFTGDGYTPHRTPRAAYAAMVSRLDRDVGRLLALLEELGLEKDTIVFFSSDNGTADVPKEVDAKFFQSVGPLRGLKGSLYEGGIRVPMIVRWPGKIPAGTTTDHISAFWDIVPTVAELVGFEVPAGIDGISFAPTLLGRAQEQKQHEYLYWEFPGYGGQLAVRLGPWKGVKQRLQSKGGRLGSQWELYNLENDIGERQNLAHLHPEIVEKIEQIVEQAHRPNPLFPMIPLDPVE